MSERHYAAVLDAEVLRLARELRSLGPMPCDQLARLTGATKWREETFEAAVRRGVAQGRLGRLAFDFIAASEDPARAPPARALNRR